MEQYSLWIGDIVVASKELYFTYYYFKLCVLGKFTFLIREFFYFKSKNILKGMRRKKQYQFNFDGQASVLPSSSVQLCTSGVIYELG